MRELVEYLYNELEDLNTAVKETTVLPMLKIHYGDTVAHFLKNLMKSIRMIDDYYGIDTGEEKKGSAVVHSKYSELIDEANRLMGETHNEQSKAELQSIINKLSNMQ